MVLQIFEHPYHLLHPNFRTRGQFSVVGFVFCGDIGQGFSYLVVVLDVEGPVGVWAGVVDVDSPGESVPKFAVVLHADAAKKGRSKISSLRQTLFCALYLGDAGKLIFFP